MKKDLPDAEFIHLKDNLIPFGNAVRALTTLGEEFLAEEEESVNSEMSSDENRIEFEAKPSDIEDGQPVNND